MVRWLWAFDNELWIALKQHSTYNCFLSGVVHMALNKTQSSPYGVTAILMPPPFLFEKFLPLLPPYCSLILTTVQVSLLYIIVFGCLNALLQIIQKQDPIQIEILVPCTALLGVLMCNGVPPCKGCPIFVTCSFKWFYQTLCQSSHFSSEYYIGWETIILAQEHPMSFTTEESFELTLPRPRPTL